MKKFRSFLAVLLTFCIAISFISISNTYAVTEMSQEERDRIESIFGCVMERENTSSLFSARSSRTIADGVYYIKNNYSGKYLQVRDDSTEDNSVPEQWSKKTANPTDTEPNRLSQLWRVTYVSGYYILRPLHMLNLALGGQPSSHYITSVLYSTNNVITYCEWEITAANGGYSIGSSLMDKALCLKENSTNNGVELSFTTDFTNTSAIWTFEEATNVPSGVMVYAPQATVTKGKDFTITASAYSPSLQFGTVTWQSSNTAVATATEPSSGITESRLVKRVITGVAQGSANIIITSNTDTTVSKTFVVGVGEIDSGTYYSRNLGSGNYLDIESSSTSSGANICQWAGTGLNSQRWIIELQTDGYYTIKSAHSSLYLSVTNNSASTGVQVIQSTGGTESGQLWKITVLSDNSYKIIPKCGESSNRVLSVQSNNAASGTKAVSKTYDTGDYCKWLLSPAIFGSQAYRDVNDDSINCFRYAIMSDISSAMFDNALDDYIETLSGENAANDNEYRQSVNNGAADLIHEIFVEWANSSESTITLTVENNFSGNGENNVLNENQYRVVLRTGSYLYTDDEGKHRITFDYHFWYQTFDGRWANKHGQLPSELLPDGVIPSSINTTGWALYPYYNFYNSEIHSFIITV